MQQEVFKVLCDRFGFKGKDVFSAGLYDTDNQWVRDEAAKRGKPVLEFQAKDGWKPLYNFLDKPSPLANVPFPHLNDQHTIAIVKTIRIVRGLLVWSTLGGVVYAGIKFGSKWFK